MMPQISELAAAILGLAFLATPLAAKAVAKMWPSQQVRTAQVVSELLVKQTAILDELLHSAHRGEVQRERDEVQHAHHFRLTEDGIKEQRQMLMQITREVTREVTR